MRARLCASCLICPWQLSDLPVRQQSSPKACSSVVLVSVLLSSFRPCSGQFSSYDRTVAAIEPIAKFTVADLLSKMCTFMSFSSNLAPWPFQAGFGSSLNSFGSGFVFFLKLGERSELLGLLPFLTRA